jgi:SOS response regulatory protein OraA/RecX
MTSAREQALIRLNVREYSAGEMRMYLKRKGYELTDIDPVITELVERGLISDERYSKIIARHSAARGKGPGYIQAKLRQKGVRLGSEQAKALFQEHSMESEIDLARRILDSRYPDAFEGPKERQRAYAGLIRRGISHETTQQALRRRDTRDSDPNDPT